MKVNTVNISFQPQLLKMITRVAQQESRGRSELIREAARMYIARKNQWEKIFLFGKKQTENLKLKEDDVTIAVKAHRQSKRKT